jgi:DUF4097 and DUF4098 domain-containing protein YvlB
MKFNSSIITVLLAVLLFSGGATTHAQQAQGRGAGRGEGAGRGQGTGQGEDKSKPKVAEAVIATTDTVNVSLTTESGTISLVGWDRNEVRAQTKQSDTKIELRKADGANAASPAARLEILVYEDSEDGETVGNNSDADADVIVNVPRGATVYLKTENGDIEVDNVAEAHIETIDGRIEARRISKATEATSVSGNVALEDASGRARLSSLAGVIEIRDLRQVDAGDFVKIRTSSGDILLEGIGPARVEASTIAGELKLMGSLSHGGTYNFTTTTGDVTIVLPTDSSFNLNAKISEGGEIVTEFPLTYKGAASPASLLQAGRLMGTYGAGGATINLVSFSGTLRLRKQ